MARVQLESLPSYAFATDITVRAPAKGNAA